MPGGGLLLSCTAARPAKIRLFPEIFKKSEKIFSRQARQGIPAGKHPKRPDFSLSDVLALQAHTSIPIEQNKQKRAKRGSKAREIFTTGIDNGYIIKIKSIFK